MPSSYILPEISIFENSYMENTFTFPILHVFLISHHLYVFFFSWKKNTEVLKLQNYAKKDILVVL